MEIEKKIDVSIVLPCYNEAGYIEKAVREISAVMDATKYGYEIIIAEDASSDNSKEVIQELMKRYANIVWLHRDVREGRGSAVSNAFMRSNGRICGFIDTDLETPAYYIIPLLVELEKGADVSSAIRIFKITWMDILYFPKFISTHVYKIIARVLLKTDLRDSEVGCKFFKKEKILPILPQIKNKHWFWDTEIMVRPYYENYAIKEIPTLFIRDWAHPSKQNLLRDSIEHLRWLLKFRKEIKETYNFKKKYDESRKNI